jgi:hypothetical protein
MEQRTVFERITVEAIEILDAAFEGPSDDRKIPTHIRHLTLQCRLKNHSERNIFFRIKREHHSIGGKVRPDAHFDPGIQVIPVKGSLNIALATINRIELPQESGPTPLKGKIELEIEYGPKEDKLYYLFDYIGEPSIAFAISGDKAELRIVTPIKKNLHRSF